MNRTMENKTLLTKKPQACHFGIAAIAKEMAGAFYESAARDNDFYKFFPSQEHFIRREWWRFISTAEQILWAVLRGERDQAMRGQGYTEEFIIKAKDDAYDMLTKQGTLPKDGKMVTPRQFMMNS